MPVSIIIEAKSIAVNDNTRKVLTALTDALKSQGIEKLEQVAPNEEHRTEYWWLKHAAEIISGKHLGSMAVMLGKLTIRIDPPANWVREEYQTCLNDLLKTHNLGPNDTETNLISNPYVVACEILMRLITTAFDTNMDPDRDGNKIANVIETFVDQLNKSDVLHQKPVVGTNRLSNFNKFLISTHRSHWLPLIRGMVNITRSIRLNQDIISNCLNDLNNVIYLLKVHLACRLNTKITNAYLSKRWIDSSIQTIEENALHNFSQKSKHSRVMTVTSYTEKAAIIGQQANMQHANKITRLYASLEDASLLSKILNYLDLAFTTMGWLPLLLGLIQLRPLAEKLNAFYKSVANILDLTKDPILEDPVGKELALIDCKYNSSTVQFNINDNLEFLQRLNNKVLLKKIGNYLRTTVSGILDLQQRLKIELINTNLLETITDQVSSPPRQIARTPSDPRAIKAGKMDEDSEDVFGFKETLDSQNPFHFLTTNTTIESIRIKGFAKQITDCIFEHAKKKLVPNKELVTLRKYHSGLRSEEFESHLKQTIMGFIEEYFTEKNLVLSDDLFGTLIEKLNPLMLDLFYPDFWENTIGQFWKLAEIWEEGCIRIDENKINKAYIWDKLNQALEDIPSLRQMQSTL